jgi:argininosuccinate lyase
MKLWEKEGVAVSDRILEFTVGRDREFDMQLAKYDVQGSIAHVTMLCSVGLLQKDEYVHIEAELHNILHTIESGNFVIDESSEDIHSQIEQMLTERIGEAGKKIHTGRSRNDQVAVDIKLYLRSELHIIKSLVRQLFDQLIKLSNEHADVLMPGYTHLQVAMPSSFGLWFGAYAESLVDDMEILLAARKVVNKNPLGSGAGYGSSFPLNREMTTELLNFDTLNYNSIYAQMARGKTEKIVAQALSNIAATLSRFSMDVCLYMSQNFGFISFPAHLTTGSSIMPHKKNPDVFELIRAKCNRIQALPNEMTLLLNNLPSGYHRDMQLTKEILFPAINDMKACLEIMPLMLNEVEVNDSILNDEKYRHLFTVERINELVNQGVPFRDAYKMVSIEVEAGNFQYESSLNHKHAGSIGNLCNEQIVCEMEKLLSH